MEIKAIKFCLIIHLLVCTTQLGMEWMKVDMEWAGSAAPLAYHVTKLQMQLRGNASKANRQNYFFQTTKEQEIFFFLCLAFLL